MRHTKRSYLLLITLVLTVVFFSGLNLGKYIQNIDNTYVPPTPTPKPSPVQDPSDDQQPTTHITFEMYVSDTCGVSFLVPSYLSKRQTPETESEFTNGQDRIFVNCDDSFIADQEKLFINFEASQEAKIANQSVTQYTNKSSYLWVVRNSKRQKVLFETSSDLTVLIQQTLELQ